jgi:predicted dehydrogenase
MPGQVAATKSARQKGEEMVKVAVIGVGHFGREHARVYSRLEEAHLIAVCDVNEERGKAVAAELGVQFVSDFRELIGHVDAVSLAVPTAEHRRIACELLDAGVSVLVEKPIAQTLEEADAMIAAADRSRSVLQVGHLERFNPAVIAAREIATRPRFFEAHRLSVFTPRSLDIDVVMDLMIHDIDIVLSLVESRVAEIRAAGVAILTPRIDIANARIEFDDGCVANLTASRVSGERVRKLRFFQKDHYIAIDYSLQEATVVSVARHGSRPELTSSQLATHRGEPLRLELESFLRAVKGAAVEVSGADGRKALALAISVTEKIREHAQRAGIQESTSPQEQE